MPELVNNVYPQKKVIQKKVIHKYFIETTPIEACTLKQGQCFNVGIIQSGE